MILNRLWNITRDNMSCLKGDANRRKAPSLQDHLAPVIMEMDPEEGIEDQYKVTTPATAWAPPDSCCFAFPWVTFVDYLTLLPVCPCVVHDAKVGVAEIWC